MGLCKEAVDEMMRARTLCAKANACMPDDPAYVGYLEELFGRKHLAGSNLKIGSAHSRDFSRV